MYQEIEDNNIQMILLFDQLEQSFYIVVRDASVVITVLSATSSYELKAIRIFGRQIGS